MVSGLPTAASSDAPTKDHTIASFHASESEKVYEETALSMSVDSVESFDEAIAARDAMLSHLARKERRAHYKARAIQLVKVGMAVEAVVSLIEGCLHASKHECERPLDAWLISFAGISFTFDLTFLLSSCLSHKHGGATDRERACARILEIIGWICLMLIIAWCIVGDYWAFIADPVECDQDLRYSVTSISAIALFSLTILVALAFIYGVVRCARTPDLDRRRQHRRDVLGRGEEALAKRFASRMMTTTTMEPAPYALESIKVHDVGSNCSSEHVRLELTQEYDRDVNDEGLDLHTNEK